MDDEATAMQPAMADATCATEPEDDARSPLPSSPAEVAKELVAFLSQLSPFRIHSYRDDHGRFTAHR